MSEQTRRIVRLFRRYRRRLAVVLALIVLSAALGTATPFLLREVLDTAIPQADTTLLSWLVGGMIAVAVVTGGRPDVHVDGRRPARHARSAHRGVPLARTVGIVSQETYLFHPSIAANLRFARPDAPDDELVAATRAARIHDLVASLPEGYDTVVGERGYRFSGTSSESRSPARSCATRPCSCSTRRRARSTRRPSVRCRRRSTRSPRGARRAARRRRALRGARRRRRQHAAARVRR